MKGSVAVLISLLKGEISQEEYMNYNNIKIVNMTLPKRIYGFIFNDKLNISILNLVFLSIFTGIVGQIGDLIASSIKRFAEIKDFGNLIPGHGGILDRFDSILMISIVVFVFSQILM